MKMHALRSILFAIAFLLIGNVGSTRADVVLAANAVPAPAVKIKEFFSGRTWVWPCKKCGAYFNPDGTFVAVASDKGTTVVGHGTWSASDGQLCWDATWAHKGGTDPVKHECWEMKYGSSKDKRFKAVLAIKYPNKNGYFWAYQDKKVWKEFVKGDRIGKNAATIEAGFSS